MDSTKFNTPLPLTQIHLEDSFWTREMELVRTEMIPYQWQTLNDRVEGADPSFCVHNFRAAAKLTREKKEQGSSFIEPKYTFRGFETLPEDPEHPDPDKFYGFVFQDSDLYKWIEAVAYSLNQHPDPELEKTADGVIDLIVSAQQENGYLDTYYIINGMDKIFTNLRDHHELYCFGHLTEAAVAYHQATEKDKLLKAACRFADFIISRFGTEPGKIHGYPGHEIAEMALVRLYGETGEKKYLELSEYFLNQRGVRPYYFDSENHPEVDKKTKIRYSYNQAHEPVREQSEAVGHAVRAMYLYSGMTDVARLTEDDSLYEACRKLWESTTREKMYVTGGVGGTAVGEAFSFPFDLPNDLAYSETCAAIGLVFFARRMLQIDPDSRYADVMELALHNGVISGMALDGKSFFYVNPLQVLPEACHKDERKRHVVPVRRKWFGCACCPPNLARLVSSIGEYAFTERDDTMWIHLYTGGTVEKKVGNRTVPVRISSGFPWDGEADVTVDTEEPVRMTLAFRIPGWCGEGFEMTGAQCKECREEKGYLYVTGEWSSKDRIHLHFPMKVRVLQADTRVREDEGRVCVTRGPIVYCLEQKDNGENLDLIRLKGTAEFTEERSSEFGSGMVMLHAAAERELPEETDTTLYHEYRKPKTEPVSLRFIPYFTWANRGENEMTVWVRAK